MSQPSFGKSRFADMTSLIFPGRNLVFSASSWQPVLVPVMPIGVEHLEPQPAKPIEASAELTQEQALALTKRALAGEV